MSYSRHDLRKMARIALSKQGTRDYVRLLLGLSAVTDLDPGAAHRNIKALAR